MHVKPSAQQGAALAARWTLGGPWRKPSAHFFVLFALFGYPGVLFRVILDALGDAFSFLFSILRFRCFFLLYGPPNDPPGHQKTMKIIVLSSKIKVSPKSRKSGSGFDFSSIFGSLWDAFGRKLEPWNDFCGKNTFQNAI